MNAAASRKVELLKPLVLEMEGIVSTLKALVIFVEVDLFIILLHTLGL